MSAIAHIRKNVLGVSQAALAAMTGVTQATVSRWENDELSPNLREITIIRDAAREKLPDAWDDAWLFDPPADGATKLGDPASFAPVVAEDAA